MVIMHAEDEDEDVSGRSATRDLDSDLVDEAKVMVVVLLNWAFGAILSISHCRGNRAPASVFRLLRCAATVMSNAPLYSIEVPSNRSFLTYAGPRYDDAELNV